MDNIVCDILIIGSGIAGLTVAWKLAKENFDVVLITKKERTESNTNYAQGGIASVVSPTDTFDSHVKDTLIAGDGLCDKNVVEFVIKNGPERIKELMDIGVEFSTNENGSLDLGKEGGHSERRVIHAKDLTGREIERALLNYCEKFTNLLLLENKIAIDLIKNSNNKITGAYVLDRSSSQIFSISSKKTVIATGGAGKVYQITSNPNIATGDGMAIAARAGASIGNIEFTQFHPTCVYNPKARPTTFLISEALRGEGAKLVDRFGNRFMGKYDERVELAPRDIVARAIDSELKSTGAECVYLDITHHSKEFILDRFPGIYHKLKNELNIDMSIEPIPVVPAAHYFCGGIIIDLEGKTDLENVYAVGEVSCSGLHGANRLASNSLLEALVFANSLTIDIIKTIDRNTPVDTTVNFDNFSKSTNQITPKSDEKVLINQNWDELRLTMWNYVGIVRSNQRLQRALKRIMLIKEEIAEVFYSHKLNSDLIELRNLCDVAELIVRSAKERKESRGIHYNIDYPSHSDKVYPSVLRLNLGTKNYEYFTEHPYINQI
jgi:L-aspartate oxidase